MSETSRCRSRLAKYCEGMGLDLGFGGDPIAPTAITVHLPQSYTGLDSRTQDLAGNAGRLHWLSDGSLDYVFSSHLFEDLPPADTLNMVLELSRVLKPDGYLVLYLPDVQMYRAYCEKTAKDYNPAHQNHDFSLAWFEEEVVSNLENLRVVHSEPLVEEYSFEIVVQKVGYVKKKAAAAAQAGPPATELPQEPAGGNRRGRCLKGRKTSLDDIIRQCGNDTTDTLNYFYDQFLEEKFDLFMPRIPTASVLLGRNVLDGAFRSWGLEFGSLKELVFNDPLYQEAERLVQSRTLIPRPKLANLYLLIRCFIPRLQLANIIEFGSYRGGSVVFMGFVAKSLGMSLQVYGLDTFSGMPQADARIDLHGSGDFGDADIEEIREFVTRAELHNVHFVPGLFQDTAEELLNRVGPIALAHIDCDIESAVTYAYNVVKPFMVPGGYIVFDDPLQGSCMGALQAVENCVVRRDGLHAEQAYPHLIFRYPPLVSEPVP